MAYLRPDIHKAVEENNIVDVVFQDPFLDEARKAKRNLVGASFVALLISSLQLQVSGFLGIQTVTGAAIGTTITSGLACLVVIYFFASFILSAYVDYSAWKFKRERFLIKPYIELIQALESHFHVVGEQINNATQRLEGLTFERGMREELEYSEVGLIDLYGLKAVSVDKQTNHSIVAQLQL